MPIKFDTGLTKGQQELLYLMIEEAGEVIQAATKVLRHGYNSTNPLVPPSQLSTNKADLEKELGHLNLAIGMLVANGDVSQHAIELALERKADVIHKWLHFAIEEVAEKTNDT